jgi:hypothetical protein
MTIKILIATPCFNNQLYTGYFHSIIKTIEYLNKMNIQFNIATTGNESLVTRARNYFVSIFLANPEYTHLLFIDADIVFNPMSIVRMVLAEKDIIAGVYPKKGIQWNKIYEIIKNNNKLEEELIQEITNDYAVNLKKHNNDNYELKLENGFLRVSYTATGFMMIRRNVFIKMMEKYPECKYTNDVLGYNNGNNVNYFYSFFDCFIDKESNRYLSEDYAFCKRWIDLNGEIWIDLLCNLNHFGSFEFKGNYFKFLEFHKFLVIKN